MAELEWVSSDSFVILHPIVFKKLSGVQQVTKIGT
jgi:hypothetical protein